MSQHSDIENSTLRNCTFPNSTLQNGTTAEQVFENVTYAEIWMGCSVTVDVVYMGRKIQWTIHVGRKVTRTRRTWTIHHSTPEFEYFPA